METFRDVKTGQITVRGKDFTVVIQEDGRVTSTGKVQIIEPPQPVEQFFERAGVYGNPANQEVDEPPPRSQPAVRKRGSR